jgi:hypothetical protein
MSEVTAPRVAYCVRPRNNNTTCQKRSSLGAAVKQIHANELYVHPLGLGNLSSKNLRHSEMTAVGTPQPVSAHSPEE